AHAEALPAETVQLYYQIALKSREDLPWALDARSGLEMALLRMLAFTPAATQRPPAAAAAGAGGQQVQTDAPVSGEKKKSLSPEAQPRPVVQDAPASASRGALPDAAAPQQPEPRIVDNGASTAPVSDHVAPVAPPDPVA